MPAVIQPWLQLPHCLCCQQPLPSEGAVSVQPLLPLLPLPLLEEEEAELPDCWPPPLPLPPQRPQVEAQ